MQLHLFCQSLFKGFARAKRGLGQGFGLWPGPLALLYCITDKYINLSFNLKFTKFLSQNPYNFNLIFYTYVSRYNLYVIVDIYLFLIYSFFELKSWKI